MLFQTKANCHENRPQKHEKNAVTNGVFLGIIFSEEFQLLDLSEEGTSSIQQRFAESSHFRIQTLWYAQGILIQISEIPRAQMLF